QVFMPFSKPIYKTRPCGSGLARDGVRPDCTLPADYPPLFSLLLPESLDWLEVPLSVDPFSLLTPLSFFGLVLLPLASPPLPPPIEPGGSAFSGPEPAFISVDGGIPPLSTGASLPANAAHEHSDIKPAIAMAVIFDLIMVHSFSKLLT
ncbi:hypothetical protein, partial [Pseudomonas sp. SDO55104_S430]